MAVRAVGNYKTESFRCWHLFKELRQDLYQDITEAREKGKLLASGSASSNPEILAGFGEFEFLAGEPYGATIGNMPDFQSGCFEEMEARGWARDLCGYLRGYLGSMYLDKTPWGSPFPKPDLIATQHSCDTHAKWYQAVSEHLGIPMFVFERPAVGGHHAVEYAANQLLEFIEWAERALGRKYDDELLVKAVINQHRSKALWSEAVRMNQHIPAPMDYKSMATFYLPARQCGFKDESVRAYRELRDEVKYRVENDIAAVPTERCRLIHENIPPWYALKVLRYMEKFGVVCVGSAYLSVVSSNEFDAQGNWMGVSDFEPGKEPRTREEAVWNIAERNTPREGDAEMSTVGKVKKVLTLCRLLKVDGALWHLNRGCEGVGLGDMQVRLAVQRELSIPTCVYEGNQADIREWNEAQVLDRIDAFMEALGLERLVD